MWAELSATPLSALLCLAHGQPSAKRHQDLGHKDYIFEQKGATGGDVEGPTGHGGWGDGGEAGRGGRKREVIKVYAACAHSEQTLAHPKLPHMLLPMEGKPQGRGGEGQGGEGALRGQHGLVTEPMV